MKIILLIVFLLIRKIKFIFHTFLAHYFTMKRSQATQQRFFCLFEFHTLFVYAKILDFYKYLSEINQSMLAFILIILHNLLVTEKLNVNTLT